MSGYYDHVLICGYESGAEMLLQALLEEIDPELKPLVVFAEGERPHDLPAQFVWVEGDPTKESELGKVRITHASAAILVGSRHSRPHHADAKTILTAFTIRSYLRANKHAESRQRPVYVVAEILDSENVDHAYASGADEVIETRRLGFSLLSHAVTNPGTAALMSEVASTGAHSIFIGGPPEGYEAGKSFVELSHELKVKEGVLLIGVRDPETGEDWLNPPESLEIKPGARLLYLSETACLPR